MISTSGWDSGAAVAFDDLAKMPPLIADRMEDPCVLPFSGSIDDESFTLSILPTDILRLTVRSRSGLFAFRSYTFSMDDLACAPLNPGWDMFSFDFENAKMAWLSGQRFPFCFDETAQNLKDSTDLFGEDDADSLTILQSDVLSFLCWEIGDSKPWFLALSDPLAIISERDIIYSPPLSQMMAEYVSLRPRLAVRQEQGKSFIYTLPIVAIQSGDIMRRFRVSERLLSNFGKDRYSKMLSLAATLRDCV